MKQATEERAMDIMTISGGRNTSAGRGGLAPRGADVRPVRVRAYRLTKHFPTRLAFDIDRQLFGARLVPVGDVREVLTRRTASRGELGALLDG